MIEIADYDPNWPATFATLRGRVEGTLPGLARRVEHVGSTAVPGLAGKPIVDLAVVVDTLDDLPVVIDQLAALGYRHEGELGVAGRHAFASPAGDPAHHLYVCAADNRNLAEVLAFRDYLRTHPDTARAYAELKRFLAERFGDNHAGYTAAKAAFITRVVAALTDS